MSDFGIPMMGKGGERRVQQHISSLSNTAARGMYEAFTFLDLILVQTHLMTS